MHVVILAVLLQRVYKYIHAAHYSPRLKPHLRPRRRTQHLRVYINECYMYKLTTYFTLPLFRVFILCHSGRAPYASLILGFIYSSFRQRTLPLLPYFGNSYFALRQRTTTPPLFWDSYTSSFRQRTLPLLPYFGLTSH